MNPGNAPSPAGWDHLLAGVLARSRLVVAMIDADGVVAWCNEAAQAIGLAAGDPLSRVLEDRPAPTDDDPAASALARLHDAVVAQRPMAGVDLPLRADPQRWWRVELQLLGDVSPRPDGVRAAVALQEVTALRRAREAMSREAQLLREAAAIAGVGAWDLDLQDHRLRWSDEVRRIHDLPPDSQPDLAAALAFYDDTSREAATAALERAMRDGTPFDLVLSLHTAAGRRRWVRCLGNAQRAVGPDGSPGPVVRLAGVTQDVTERFAAGRALAELGDRLRLATQASGLGVWELRLTPECLVWDARTAALHGVPPDAQVDLAVWRACVEPADWPAVDAALRPLRDGRTGQVDLRYRVRIAPSGHRHLESLCRAVSDGGDRRLLGICLDTTERVQHAQAMLDKAAAERASQAKSEFLSRVSHELRTPLHGILGYAQWLASRAGELPEWSRDAVTAVHQAGQHLLALVDDTLDLGAIETGAVRLSCVPVGLDDVVDEALTVTAALPQAAGLRLLPWPPGAPEALADRTRLRQVLLNLLSNAVKYNRPGGRVRIDWTRQGGQVRIAVSDDGPGLPPQRRDELFQPFNRLGAEAGPVPGSGLGLAIARQLTEAMGGRIEAEPASGAGTTLALWLPLAAAGDAAPDAGTGAESPVLTVLYVEDNPVNATLMREVIAVQAPTWRLVISPDGEQGLRDAAALRPDVLLLDINLPGISGHEVLAGVRAMPALAGAVCIAVSADAMPDEVQRALANGFDQYWTKPLDVPSLARRIAQAAGARRRPAA